MKLLIGCILTSLGSFIFGMGLGKVMISIRANINMYINERRLIMKLLNFKQNNQVKIGVQTDQGILDLQLAGDQLDKKVPTSMEELIQVNDLSLISEIVDEALQNTKDSTFLSEDEITFAPIVTNPEKILCVGLNYLDHVEESGDEEVPDEPVIFSKFNNALAAHNESIPVPTTGKQFDYEAEMILVIGKEAKDVSKEEALDYVFGYSIGNDLSVRDLQFKSGRQWLIGKTPDKFAPIGPYLVTADSIDSSHLDISMKRNGKTVQFSNTKHMIFDCATIISYLSKHMTLKPGDIIFTGTPEGVIFGLPEDERDWLASGDQLEVTIESLGTLKNTLV